MLKINIEISETADGLTDIEKAVLAALSGSNAQTLQVGEVKVSTPVEAPTKEAPAEAPAEPEKPKRTRRTKAEIDAEKKAKEAEAAKEAEVLQEVEAKTLQEELAEEDTSEDSDEKPTMDDAVSAATVLVSAGRQQELKKILETLETPRVSKLADKDIPAFLQAVKELG